MSDDPTVAENQEQPEQPNELVNPTWALNVMDARKRVKALEVKEEQSRLAHKADKSALERGIKELLAAIDASEQPGLFDQLPLNADASEGWRDVLLSTLELPEGLLKCLDEAELRTVGAIADYVGEDHQLIDIKGIGEGNAEKLENALTTFWAKWNTAADEPTDD